jgi:hypothetical protein
MYRVIPKKDKFEKLAHLVGFTIEMYYDARPYERHIQVILRFYAFLKKFAKIVLLKLATRPHLCLLLFLFWHLANVDPAKRHLPRAALVNLIIICRNLFHFQKIGEKKITYVQSYP